MLTLPISLILIHLVGDFFLQTDWMALGKSKSWKPLLAHTAIYSLCFAYFGLAFTLVTFFTHTLTDAVTSRVTSRLWFVKTDPVVFKWADMKHYENEWTDLYHVTFENTKRHWFFVCIGVDQVIHYVTLALTYNWLFK